MNKKLHIEMLRIIAVVMVVLNHSDLYYTYYTYYTVVPEAVFAACRSDIRNICMLGLYLLYFAV